MMKVMNVLDQTVDHNVGKPTPQSRPREINGHHAIHYNFDEAPHFVGFQIGRIVVRGADGGQKVSTPDANIHQTNYAHGQLS
uniref:Uncharacterized protein n=1 Tax=Romanomermis culicivorax TaxID=13658 RepID=A0A915KV68_ROMCU